MADVDLEPNVRELLNEARQAMEGDGWSVHVERNGILSLVFTNPLSPAMISFGLSRDNDPARDRRRLVDFINQETEFLQLRRAPPPQRKRRLLRVVRGSAASNLWTDETYQQVVDMLAESQAITSEEWEWLKAVGPEVFPEHIKRDLMNLKQLGEHGSATDK